MPLLNVPNPSNDAPKHTLPVADGRDFGLSASCPARPGEFTSAHNYRLPKPDSLRWIPCSVYRSWLPLLLLMLLPLGHRGSEFYPHVWCPRPRSYWLWLLLWHVVGPALNVRLFDYWLMRLDGFGERNLWWWRWWLLVMLLLLLLLIRKR